jgi:BirA family transcriptional regulator, biotin operon repressor / biotin---[acetyl-CoA-carboxylase] ligase
VEYPITAGRTGHFEYLPKTGSTNQDLLQRATELPELAVLATDFQSRGRGRLDRSWQAEPGSSILASVLFRPSFANPAGLGWLSLLTALAIAKALQELGLPARIKWPNDILISNKKVSGILAEALPDLSAVVVGFGINVSQQPAELPSPASGSLLSLGLAEPNRDEVLAAVLDQLKVIYSGFCDASGDAEQSGLRSEVLQHSATVGERVRVLFPNQTERVGLAKDIDSLGRLVVSDGEEFSVSAADVLHLRTA